MKHIPSFALIMALILTGCTDQPAPPQPTASSTDNPTTSPTALTDEALAPNIAQVLQHPAPEDLPTGNAALEAFNQLLFSDETENDDGCPILVNHDPEVAGFGSVTADDSNENQNESLSAFEFNDNTEAKAFTTDIQELLKSCSVIDSEVQELTHHTDEAFEIDIDLPDDTDASTLLVIVRDGNMVVASSSTPPSDVALSLTLADQLNEMLR